MSGSFDVRCGHMRAGCDATQNVWQKILIEKLPLFDGCGETNTKIFCPVLVTNHVIMMVT